MLNPETESAWRLKEGAVLRYPIHDDRGVKLLEAGTAITPRLTALLERRGVRLRLHVTLEVTEGEPMGMEIPVLGDVCRIGRGAECHIRPTSRIVSNRHCEIHRLPAAAFALDLESTNGTFINGHRFTGIRELNDRDIVSFGPMSLRVRLYAVLEGDESETKRVAGMILSEPESGEKREPALGATLTSFDSSILDEFRRLMQEAREIKDSQGDKKS